MFLSQRRETEDQVEACAGRARVVPRLHGGSKAEVILQDPAQRISTSVGEDIVDIGDWLREVVLGHVRQGEVDPQGRLRLRAFDDHIFLEPLLGPRIRLGEARHWALGASLGALSDDPEVGHGRVQLLFQGSGAKGHETHLRWTIVVLEVDLQGVHGVGAVLARGFVKGLEVPRVETAHWAPWIGERVHRLLDAPKGVLNIFRVLAIDGVHLLLHIAPVKQRRSEEVCEAVLGFFECRLRH
mmetsp:Transcript_90427/g.193883  ORF Transcript_90427/g.193883 Transcript_90427/m.193883 type:complete len:241 (+) Transcript_90427:2361-3083(+)